MKFMPLFFMFSLLLLGACQESSKKSSSSSQQNAYCTTNYYAPGCPGYNGGQTSGVTSGTTTGNQQYCYMSPQNYWQMPGCPGFCQNYPAHTNCAGGGTTSGTTSGSTTGTTTNPYPQYPSSVIYANWGVQYPGGVPGDLNCAPAVAPSGVSYTPYETRKATISVQGGTYYNPASGVPYTNTSAIMKTVSSARTFLETDSVLQLRVKVKPQPENSSSSPYCYIPNYSKMSSQAGHYRVIFSVSVVGTKANGQVEEDYIGTFNQRVNECSTPIDLSSRASIYPGGMYLKVYDVQDNTLTWPNNYSQFGFRDGASYRTVRSMDCWVMELEVAADGTKVFPQ